MDRFRIKKVVFFSNIHEFFYSCYSREENTPINHRIFDKVKTDIKSISDVAESKINSLLMGNSSGNKKTMANSATTTETSPTSTEKTRTHDLTDNNPPTIITRVWIKAKVNCKEGFIEVKGDCHEEV